MSTKLLLFESRLLGCFCRYAFSDSFQPLLCVSMQLTEQKRRYEIGLERLAFANSQVVDMQKELEALKPQLVQA